MDTVYIKNLELPAIIGIYEHERTTKQTIRINLEIDFDLAHAGKTDNIHDTLDYGLVVEKITNLVNSTTFNLLETLAEHICQLLFSEFNVNAVVLSLAKVDIFNNIDEVGIKIKRFNNNYQHN